MKYPTIAGSAPPGPSPGARGVRCSGRRRRLVPRSDGAGSIRLALATCHRGIGNRGRWHRRGPVPWPRPPGPVPRRGAAHTGNSTGTATCRPAAREPDSARRAPKLGKGAVTSVGRSTTSSARARSTAPSWHEAAAITAAPNRQPSAAAARAVREPTPARRKDPDGVNTTKLTLLAGGSGS